MHLSKKSNIWLNSKSTLGRVTLSEVGLFADGCAVARVGEETHRVIEQYVDDIITATTDEMCAAVKDIFDDTRAIAEPAGALAIAGMKAYLSRHDLTGASVSNTKNRFPGNLPSTSL